MRQTLSEFDDHDDGYGLVGEERADEYARPSRRLPTLVLSVLVMALFAGGVWFAYVQGTRHPAVTAPGGGEAVPVLRADTTPTKVKPDQPGGMVIPDQNVSLYNDGKPTGPAVEKLLPAPEQPMPRPAPVAPAPPPASAIAAPADADTPPAAAAKPPAKPATAAKPAATSSTPAAEKAGPVRVRLGSVRTPDAARDKWARLKRENADLLGNLTAVAVRTDLGDKGIFYRVEAGTFADGAAAERLCGELKRRNLGCIVAR
jgi:hypothetical protein